MLGQSTKELVSHLSHPNGWWRDTAQKLIILRKDGKSVVPELGKLARSGKSSLGRVHALWALEGLDAIDPKLIVEKLSDNDHRVRMAAVRVSEPFLSLENKALEAAFQGLEKEPHADVALQTINSIAYSGATDSETLAGIQDNLIETHIDKPILKSIAGNRAKLAQERARLAKQRKTDAHFGKQMESGAVIYKQLCFACHGNDGKGTPMVGQPGVTLAPPLPKSPRVLGSGGSLVRTVLHGQTGELDGKKYPGQMLPLGTNDDEWIADITTYVRNSFGNKGGPITKEFVADIRKESGDRLLPWTEAELEELEPPLIANRKKWKLTASHGANKLGGCVDGNGKSRYDTGASQVPGMWVKVELPSVCKVNRIQLDSQGSSRDYPRGYQVESSVDGKKWSEPLAIGVGKHPITDISFPTTQAKYLKITQTGRVNGLFWSIHEMQIFGKPVLR
jgi:mono/diheme cytochrome c family protein